MLDDKEFTCFLPGSIKNDLALELLNQIKAEMAGRRGNDLKFLQARYNASRLYCLVAEGVIMDFVLRTTVLAYAMLEDDYIGYLFGAVYSSGKIMVIEEEEDVEADAKTDGEGVC